MALKYTGHPLFDVGVATIAAFTKKRDLTQINEEDLDRVVEFITCHYVRDPLKSFLTVAFPNSGFTNPAFEKSPGKRIEYARKVLSGYKKHSPRLKEICAFTGEPAMGVALSDSIPPGRAFRQHVPLVTGEGVVNFYPWGDAGIPISGEALLAIHAFPMGCAKCGGKLLAVHSDNTYLMFDFATEFLEYNKKALLLAEQSGEKKMPEAHPSARTLLIQTLLELEIRRREEAREQRPFSVTAYHLSNSGQSNALDARNPPLELYHLPFELTDFLCWVVSPEYFSEWSRMVKRSWIFPTKKGKRSEVEESRPVRNRLYEDLFRLPENASMFLRRYFLRTPQPASDDPQHAFMLKGPGKPASWSLIDLFLRRVIHMDKERVQQIRELGDRLASYVNVENDRKFFMRFYEERNYEVFRNSLMRANLNWVRHGHDPLIMLEPYIKVFEEGDNSSRPDWRLSRDLVLMRMIEQLYQHGWLGKHPEVIPEEREDETPAES